MCDRVDKSLALKCLELPKLCKLVSNLKSKEKLL